MRIEVAGVHRLLVARVADDDLREPRLEVGQRFGEAEDRHHLGGDDDVEAVLSRIAVRGAAERHGDVAQRAVVHVDDALPRDAAHVDAERVAVVDVIVDQRGEQVVRDADRVEVAGEMQVDVLHRHDLRVAAAGGAALHPEHGPERRLAQADRRLLADPIERIAQADGRRRLALARGRRADGGDEDQLAVGTIRQSGEPIERDLGLGAPVGLDGGIGNARAARRSRRWATVWRAARFRYRFASSWILCTGAVAAASVLRKPAAASPARKSLYTSGPKPARPSPLAQCKPLRGRKVRLRRAGCWVTPGRYKSPLARPMKARNRATETSRLPFTGKRVKRGNLHPEQHQVGGRLTLLAVSPRVGGSSAPATMRLEE